MRSHTCPSSHPRSMLCMAWGMLMVVATATYTAALTARLTRAIVQTDIQGFEDVTSDLKV